MEEPVSRTPRPQIALALALAWGISASAQEIPSGVTEPSFFANLFDGDGRALKGYYEKNDAEGFLGYYDQHQESLSPKKDKYAYWFYAMARQANQHFAKLYQDKQPLIEFSINSELPRIQEWPMMTVVCREFAEECRNYSGHALLKEAPFRSPVADPATALCERMKKFFGDRQAQAFGDYLKLSPGSPFEVIYPFVEDSRVLYRTHLDEILDGLRVWPDASVQRFYATSARFFGPEELGRVLGAILQNRQDADKLNALPKMLRFMVENQVPEEAQKKFLQDNLITILYTSSDGAGDADYQVAIDQVAPVPHSRADLKASLPTDPHTYVLLITELSGQADSKRLGDSEQASQYVAYTKRTHNPAWDRAQRRLEQAEAEAEEMRANAMKASANAQGGGLNALPNLFGAAAGTLMSDSDLRAARREANSTPEELVEEVMESYNYTVSSFNASRTTAVRAWFGSEATGFVELEKKLEKQQPFQVARDVHDKDPRRSQIMASLQTKEAMEAWKGGAETIALGTLLEGPPADALRLPAVLRIMGIKDTAPASPGASAKAKTKTKTGRPVKQ